MKHDAHVLKFKMQFLPIKTIVFIAILFFTIGVWLTTFLSLVKCSI